MAPRDRPHIVVRRPAVAEPYTSYDSGRGSPRPPAPIRQEHARRLTDEANRVARETLERRSATARELGVSTLAEGTLVTFESWPGFELELKSLDPLSRGTPELLAVHARGTGDDRVEYATVYVPGGNLGYFLRKLEEYAAGNTVKGNPKNANLVERIAALRLATIRELWTDDPEAFPDPHAVRWWEVWLRRSDGNEVDRLQQVATQLGFSVGERKLVFDNRVIVLVRATATGLASALDVIDDFAELRAAHVNSEFFTGLAPAEQADWIDDLVRRTAPPDGDAPAACILDTGVNRGHPLLAHSLAEEDLHTSDPSWGTADHDGHGTEMAGVSLYGDGRYGCHGGSALSGVGGSLRPGELSGPDPIRHALKFNVYAKRFLSCTNNGYRWPAYRADAYMDCSSYGGNVPAMRMGSLLALLPSVNCDTVVSSRQARKLCVAFQDYGAYVVDDTYWDVHAIALDENAEFGDGGSFDSDMQRLFQMLQVVDNNSPSSIGGGGTPRAPLAPPIGN